MELPPFSPPPEAAMTKPLKFTMAAVENLVPPASGRLIVSDTACKTLKLRVMPSGVKTFFWQQKVNGRKEVETIGHFPQVRPDTARARAVELSGLVASGRFVRKTKAEAPPKEVTLGDAIEHARAHHWSRLKTQGRDHLYFLGHAKSLWRRPLPEITRADVVRLHTQLGEDRGEFSANRTLSYLRAVFNIAAQDGLFTGTNPAAKVKRFPEQSRERFLSPSEVTKLLEVIASAPDHRRDAADMLLILLLSGVRKSNALSMRWEAVDLPEGLWTIARSESKSGKTMTIPLVPALVSLLERRRATSTSPWVFPSRTCEGHIKELRSAHELFEQASIAGVRLHDLRRTLGSTMAARGVSEIVIAKTLGHSSTAATKVYTRLAVQTVRESLESVTGGMLGGSGDSGAS